MLTQALEHYRRQQRISAAGLIEARKARKRGPVEVAKVVTLYQLAAARDAERSVGLMLEEQNIDPRPVGTVAHTALVGVASDGRALDTLFEQADTEWQFGLMVATQLQDVARAAAGLGIAARPQVGGYVRMLNPPSCSRCAVQAGRFFRWNAGFERHPRCDCRHVPTGDARMASELGLIDDPNDYFGTLSKAEQDRVFTKAGAEAIRDGADVTQVVNARRGMSVAGTSQTTTRVINGETFVVNTRRRTLIPEQVGGRDVFITREGTTKRGMASRQRTGRNMSARLMPESIYRVADSREDAIRMLRLHGYIL